MNIFEAVLNVGSGSARSEDPNATSNAGASNASGQNIFDQVLSVTASSNSRDAGFSSGVSNGDSFAAILNMPQPEAQINPDGFIGSMLTNMSSGSQTSPEQQQAEGLVGQFDTDGEAGLSPAELQTLKNAAASGDPDAQAVLDNLNLMDAYLAGPSTAQAAGGTEPVAAFDVLDVDGNGSLSAQELASALNGAWQGEAVVLTEGGADGLLSESELQSAVLRGNPLADQLQRAGFETLDQADAQTGQRDGLLSGAEASAVFKTEDATATQSDNAGNSDRGNGGSSGRGKDDIDATLFNPNLNPFKPS